jgi:hypothetical protein
MEAMTLTEQQLESLKIAATPLMEWLKDNCHPHVTAIVDSQRCEVLEGLATTTRDRELTKDERMAVDALVGYARAHYAKTTP